MSGIFKKIYVKIKFVSSPHPLYFLKEFSYFVEFWSNYIQICKIYTCLWSNFGRLFQYFVEFWSTFFNLKKNLNMYYK